jgi:hypothetical protein
VLALAWDNLGLRTLNSAVRFLGLCQGAHPTLQLICSRMNITTIDKKRVKKTYVFRLKYITGRVRTNHFYKILSQLVLKDPCRQFYAKICNVLNSSILDFDNSGINKYKKLLLRYLANR